MYKMKMGRFGCPHHIVSMVLGILVWVAGIAFFWLSLKQDPGYALGNPGYLFSAIVVLGVMILVLRDCWCCHRPMCMGQVGEGKMCSHPTGCMCGDCDKCK